MATSSKYDLSSGSPDRPLYAGGQRGSHLAAQLDRSGSFRDMESSILNSPPSMSRSSTGVTQADASSFLQCLRFDPKVVAADHKSNRQGDFKKHLNIALGISADESPSASLKSKLLSSPIPEEIKRVKAGLRESTVKARERTKIFSEALSVFNKFFPTVPSKKRSRLEGYSLDRSNALLSSERSALGPGLGKMGIQSHAIGGNFEFEQQKSEERPKSSVPNKRTRTSMVDVRMDMRNNALVRPPGAVDRDKELPRIANSAAVQCEDRTLSMGADGWEKSKMKKKRSGKKHDVSPSTLITKPIEGYRESKQGMQHRPVADARLRVNNDSHGFRQGVANGSVGVGKSDTPSQQTSLSVRGSSPRTDLENGSLLSDRRDRPVSLDNKERANLRAVNKMSVRDEFNSASPTSSTKMNASIRGPRSGAVVGPKLTPVVNRATALSDWELSNCTNKPPSCGGVNSRKRSPPVAHWAGQRPQKISRTARRTNLIPIIPNNDEAPSLDSVSDVAGSEIGSGFGRRVHGNSPQQIKLKGETLSSAGLSESEESGPAEIKSKERVKKSDEIDEKVGPNVQKMSTVVLPSRKSKLLAGEDIGDGVRRQGRTGRGFSSTRAIMPMTVERFGNVGTAKQLRSSRLGFDKAESKAGRPPTRKLSDRRAYKRQKHAAVPAASDPLVGSDDGHEELVTAANAVVTSARAFSSPFWRQMEPFLGLICDADLAYLKQQESYHPAKLFPRSASSVADGCSTIPNGCGLKQRETDGGLSTDTSVELLPDLPLLDTRDHDAIPLYQRLMAAFIPEEDSGCGNEDLDFDVFGTGFQLDGEWASIDSSHIGSFQSAGHPNFNRELEHEDSEVGLLKDVETRQNFKHSLNSKPSSEASVAAMVTDSQYENMNINEKLYLEAQSIGILLEPALDRVDVVDDRISEDICQLEEKHHQQVFKKKGMLDKLLKDASETRVLQEKDFIQRAHDKLVTMAYKKYMACWGTTGGKSYSNKMVKQSALAFVRRTLEHCHIFEDTGKSCFSEPLFRDTFLSVFSDVNLTRPTDAITSVRSQEARVSASMGSQLVTTPIQLGHNGDNYALTSSEQTTGREDAWSNRVKKRELLLDDVVGSSSAHSGIGGSLSSNIKGKRSERDREGKGHSREVLPRNGTNKIGRPASNAKGERKSKAKPKQKTTQLSVSVNGLLGKIPEQSKPSSTSVSKSGEMSTEKNAKEKDKFALDVVDDPEVDLQLPGQDLDSWLNIDDDGLQDLDFMGLEIPMDDLSDLNMMV